VPPSFPRRDHLLHLIGEEESADPVVVKGRRQSQHGRDLDRERRLGDRLPEAGGARLVHQQHQRQLALLGERLYIGTRQPGRHVPVDGAEIIPNLVGPHFGELHPLTPEHGAILAREQRPDQPSGTQLDSLDLPQDLGGDWHRI
jgi:hypothetical protein